MPQLQVKKGQTVKLPGTSFVAGLGWDPAEGVAEKIDLDLWIIRHYADGTVDAIYWGQEDWERPDLGRNSEGNPFIATPEEDVVYKGDDRTGAESATGYDENADMPVHKAPKTVVQYSIFATYYENPNDRKGHTLGMATNVIFGCKQEGSDNELVVKLADDHPFDVTVLLCTIDQGAPDSWSITNKDEGYTDDMFTIAKKLGITFSDN